MSTKTVLSRMMEMRKDFEGDQKKFEEYLKSEFRNKTIIADWGGNRQYIITDVVFDKNPMIMTFDHEGDKVTLADYFLKSYQKQIT
jgi:hypothetical protein